MAWEPSPPEILRGIAWSAPPNGPISRPIFIRRPWRAGRFPGRNNVWDRTRKNRSTDMRFYLSLAWRNLWRHRPRMIIVVLVMGLGLSSMVPYDGLIDGFQQAIYGNAVNILGGNIRVHATGDSANVQNTPLLPLANPPAVIGAE